MTSKAIVIFGATGDLCKETNSSTIQTLVKRSLPENFIVGSARREFTSEMWKESLGYYPEEFMHSLDYVPSDLSIARLRTLDAIADDVTYFLSVPPSRYEDAIINLSESGKLDDENPVWLWKNPLGTTLNLYHLQSQFKHIREKQVYRIDHYLGKDTVSNILATRFSNIVLGSSGTAIT